MMAICRSNWIHALFSSSMRKREMEWAGITMTVSPLTMRYWPDFGSCIDVPRASIGNNAAMPSAGNSSVDITVNIDIVIVHQRLR